MDLRNTVVVAQIAAMAGIGWPGRGRWRLPLPGVAAATAVATAGTALTAAGMVSHGAQLTHRVEPPPGAELCTSGAYRVTRHPIYTGVVLAGAGLAVLRRRPEPLLSWALLTAVLYAKAGMEERWLRARFGAAYEEYAATTSQVLPLPRRGRAQDVAAT